MLVSAIRHVIWVSIFIIDFIRIKFCDFNARSAQTPILSQITFIVLIIITLHHCYRAI